MKPSHLKKQILLLGMMGSALGSLLFSFSSQAAEVTFETDTSLPLVYLNTAIKGGSVTDPPDQKGLTNFMGEMMLRGTRDRSKKEMDLSLDQIGANLTVEIRNEILVFRGAVLSSKLSIFLGLMKEILTAPSFPEEEISKLRSEIISGIEEELGNDSALVSRKFFSFLFQGHPYGNPPIGTIQGLSNITRESLLNHYTQFIRASLLLVVGTGDTQKDRLIKWSDEVSAFRLKADARMPKVIEKKVEVKAPQNPDHRRLMIVDKPDRTQTQIAVGQVGIKMSDKDFFPLYLGNYAFGGQSFSAILTSEIRVKKGWSYGANSMFRFGLQPRAWFAHLFPAAKDAPPALATTLKLIEDLKEKGLSQSQYQFAQQSLVNSSNFMYNTPRKRVENFLVEKTLELPEGFMQTYADHLKTISLNDVNAAMKRFLAPQALSIVIVGTADQLKGPLAEAAGVPLDTVQVVPYTTEE